MPTLAVTLTSLLTPAYTFRSTHSVTADVKAEFDEAILTTALLPASQASSGDQIAVLVDCGLPGIPNTAASDDLVGLCAGGQSPMRFWFLGEPVTSGTPTTAVTYVITDFQAGDDFTNAHDADSPDRAVTTPAGFTGMVFTADGDAVTWSNSSELRPVLGFLDAGGGPNDTVTDGDGDYVWPTYAGQADAAIRNAGDITMIAVTRENPGAVTGDDDDTDYNQTMDMRVAFYYDAN
jgi:hypothetical protein